MSPSSTLHKLLRATRHSVTAVTLRLAALNDAASLEAVVNAAIARRLIVLRLHDCQLGPAALPLLTKLVSQCTSLRGLELAGSHEKLLDGPSVAAFCIALRKSTLLSLSLRRVCLWSQQWALGGDGGAQSLMAALTGHPTLCEISLASNRPGGVQQAQQAVGDALGALVAAESALVSLDVSRSGLGNAALRPLFAALASNRQLTRLHCRFNAASVDFSRSILPAVRANTSLRELSLGSFVFSHALAECEAMVQERGNLSLYEG